MRHVSDPEAKSTFAMVLSLAIVLSIITIAPGCNSGPRWDESNAWRDSVQAWNARVEGCAKQEGLVGNDLRKVVLADEVDGSVTWKGKFIECDETRIKFEFEEKPALVDHFSPGKREVRAWRKVPTGTEIGFRANLIVISEQGMANGQRFEMNSVIALDVRPMR